MATMFSIPRDHVCLSFAQHAWQLRLWRHLLAKLSTRYLPTVGVISQPVMERLIGGPLVVVNKGIIVIIIRKNIRKNILI